jgi:putative component of toxin-antitoxin plasmid stabilization module
MVHMIEVRQSRVFIDWLNGLRDRAARLRIVARLGRVEMGNPEIRRRWAAA